MAQEVADLYIVLRSNAAELVPQFEGVGASAESMAAQITSSASKILAEHRAMLDSMGALTTKADEMALQFSIDYQRMQAETIRLTAAMEAQTSKTFASTEALQGKLDAAAAKSVETTAGKVAQLKKVSLAIGAVGIGVAAVTLKMAGDFEAATERLVTSAGETQTNLEGVRQGILDMAGQVGYSAMDLAKAMYTVESAGQHGAQGLKTLQAAAEGAKTENADLTTVADAVTSAMVDYKGKVDNAADVTSKLVAATSVGKTTFQDLAGSMSAVLPVASQAGVSLDDILGSLASMTVHGTSAQQAAQNLADTIRHMQAPTSVQAKELAVLGINSQDLSIKLGQSGLSGTLQMIATRIQQSMGPDATRVILNLQNALRGLPPAVQDLGQQVLNGTISLKAFTAETKGLDPITASQARSFATLAGSMHQIGNTQIDGAHVMQSYSQAMQKATGDSTGLNVALMLTGHNAADTSSRVKTIANATADAAGHVQGWTEIQSTFNQKVSEAKEGFGALAIAIGEQLLPVATKIAGVIADATHWLSQNKVAAEVLSVIVGGALVVAFSALLAVFWGFAANPVTWIIAGIVAVVLLLAAGVYLLITHWDQVASFFVGLWNTVKNAFSTAIEWVGDRIGDLIDFVKSIPSKILSGLSALGSMLLNVARTGWQLFLNGVRIGVSAAINFVKNLPHMLGEALGFLAGFLLRTAINGWNAFTNGIKTAWNATVQFFRDLPQNILKFLLNIGTWLITKGVELLVGLQNGIKNGYNAVVQFFRDLPQNVVNFLRTAATWLVAKGVELLVGLQNGIRNGYNAVVKFLRDLPSNILSFLRNAGQWLVDVGSNVIHGLWNGISAAGSWLWGKIKSFASGIIDGFKKGLGIASPSKITAEHGRYLVEGLALGINDHTQTAVTAAQALATRVTGAMAGMSATATLGLAPGSLPDGLSVPLSLASGGQLQTGIGAAGGGSQVQIINVTVPVQGSVIGERDLLKSIQQVVLRYATRNTGPGFSPAFTS